MKRVANAEEATVVVPVVRPMVEVQLAVTVPIVQVRGVAVVLRAHQVAHHTV